MKELLKIKNPLDYKIPSDERVLADDFRICLAWLSSVKKGEKFKFTERQVISILKKIINAILTKSKITIHLPDIKERDLVFSLIKKKVHKVIEVSDPALIIKGVQTAFLSKKKYSGLYFLADGSFLPKEKIYDGKEDIWGVIRVDSSKKIDPSKFLEYFDEHRVSEDDYEKTFFDSKVLYLNRFSLVATNKEIRKAYARVGGSGEKIGETIRLPEILEKLESFVISDPFIFLTGGLVNRGETANDIDVLIKGNLPDHVLKPIWFRMLRQLPKELWHRFQLLQDEGLGPYTSYVPIYRLKVERIRPPIRVELSAKEALAWDMIKAEVRVKDPKVKREAEQSKKEDKVKLFRFFYPLKTSLSAIQAYRKGEIYQIDKVIEYFKKLEERRGKKDETP